MCIALAAAPLAMLSFGVGALQAVTGYMAQSQAADRQNAYYAANARAAQQAAVNQYANEQNAIIQKRTAASADIQETNIAALKARGTVQNAAAEAGVSGLSVDELVGDYYGRQGRRVDSIDQNYQMDRDYLRAEMDSTQATAQQRINSVQQAAPPSFGDAFLRIASAGLGAATTFNRMSAPSYYPQQNMAF